MYFNNEAAAAAYHSVVEVVICVLGILLPNLPRGFSPQPTWSDSPSPAGCSPIQLNSETNYLEAEPKGSVLQGSPSPDTNRKSRLSPVFLRDWLQMRGHTTSSSHSVSLPERLTELRETVYPTRSLGYHQRNNSGAASWERCPGQGAWGPPHTCTCAGSTTLSELCPFGFSGRLTVPACLIQLLAIGH